MKNKNFTSADTGRFGERICARHLKKSGYKILKRNCRIGKLEADIIGINKTHLIFVEVKTRRTDMKNIMRPSASINKDKRDNLTSFARMFVKTMPQKYKDRQIRIDVCEVLIHQDKAKLKVEEINYIENAITR